MKRQHICTTIPRNGDGDLDEGREDVALKLVDGGLVHQLDVEDGVDDVLLVVLHVLLDDVVEADAEGPQVGVLEPRRRLDEHVGVEAVDVTADAVAQLGDAVHAHHGHRAAAGAGHPLKVAACKG